VDEKKLCQAALDVLAGKGAEGDAYLERRRSLRLHVREGRTDEISRAEVRGLAIRAIKDGRLGFVYTSKLEPDMVAQAAAQACELARSASVREELALADPSGPGDGSDEGEPLRIYDPEMEARSVDERKDWIRRAEQTALSYDPRIKRTDGASWDEDLDSVWLANTKGLFRHHRKSRVEVAVSVVAEDKGEMQPGEMSYEHTSWKDLPDPAQLGRAAADRGMRLLGGRPVETGNYPVVFSPEAGWAFLVYLSVALDGNHLSRGRSWLTGPMAGDAPVRLGGDKVTVRDDGRLPGRLGSVPFDGEGVDTRDQVLLENGLVRGRLCDLASARKLKVTPTGNAGRNGYESSPAIGAHNLWLSPGTASVDQLLAPIDRGLWVWGFSGWWIGLDPSNPNFSSAAVGQWIEKGKVVRPVARVTIAGMLRDILSGVEEIGSDLVWDHPTKTPSFRVRELSVSGS
jgi:PmbA protein